MQVTPYRYIGDYTEIVDTITPFIGQMPYQMNITLRKAISAAVNNIAAVVRRNLAQDVKGANEPLPEGGTLMEGIKVFTWKDSPTATIHIYGDQEVNDGTWRLRFFEAGTKDRFQRKKMGQRKMGRRAKGRYTGAIAPTWFFKRGIEEAEPKVYSIIKEAVSKNFNIQV